MILQGIILFWEEELKEKKKNITLWEKQNVIENFKYF